MYSQTSTPRRFFSFLVGTTHRSFAVVLVFLALTASLAAQSDSSQQQPQSVNKLRKQAEKAMRNGDFEVAASFWQDVLKIEPENHDYRLNLGYALYKQRKLRASYDEAMRVGEKIPMNPRVRALLGAVYLAAGDVEEARLFLNAALSVSREEPLALANSALLDYYENRAKDGLGKLRIAVQIEPNEPDYIFSLAQVAARTENYREAADAYTHFLRIAPQTDEDRRERIEGLIEFLKYLGNIKSLYDVGGTANVTVPCQIVNNRPVIEVRLNGRKEPLRFVLDTGSGMSVISDETAKRLKIKSVVRGGMARAIGGIGKFEIVYGFVKSMHIGDAKISRVPVYIRKFNNAGDKYDGYIGLSAISKFLTTLDYGKKTFSLVRNFDDEKNEDKNAALPQPPLPPVKIEGFSVPMRLTSSGFLSSQVKIEGTEKHFNFILDTGASISVVSSNVVQQNEMNRYMQTTNLKVYGAAGVSENVSTLLLPRISLGDVHREKISAAVLDLQPINETTGFEQSGILGGNFLQHYRLTFDFKNALVTFAPSAPN